MITTRRSTNESREILFGNARGNVAVLDREMPASYTEYTSESVQEVDSLKTKSKMHESLEKLLNYDKYQQVEEQKSAETEIVDKSVEPNEEDIRPTSTTMQFGDADINVMLNELRSTEKAEQEFSTVKKSKLAVVLYSVCVAVVLALIIINTGVIAVLSRQNKEKAEQLQAVMDEYNVSVEDYNNAVSEENIIEIAENTYNMIKK